MDCHSETNLFSCMTIPIHVRQGKRFVSIKHNSLQTSTLLNTYVLSM